MAIVLLDYTLWWWHWASHRIPFVWRFHLVHHIDRDMDASTALRFHFGELALSIPVRAAQMIVIGVDPRSLWLWQTILFGSILFHHANVRLPAGFERVLVRLIVTPRMHGIHHSNHQDQTDSNWSSLLSVWDSLHRTFRLDVPDERITIGVPAYDQADDVTIGKVLAMPFRRQRKDWDRHGVP
jgi:sterol desaturase/sphingolipid hydroxylase (fatty acid hydroxylase superfamily)